MSNRRTHETQAFITDAPEILEDNEYNFYSGEVFIETLPKPLHLVLSEAVGSFSDCIMAPGLQGLVINKKIKDIFDQIELENIQYFPVEIKTTDNKIHEYYIANIVGLYDIIDYDKSEITRNKRHGGISFFDGISFIDTDDLILPEVFRWAELKSVMIASDKVKKAVEAENCTGISFVEPESYMY